MPVSTPEPKSTKVQQAIADAIRAIEEEKPKDRSPVDRKYAILKTQLEIFHGYSIANKL